MKLKFLYEYKHDEPGGIMLNRKGQRKGKAISVIRECNGLDWIRVIG